MMIKKTVLLCFLAVFLCMSLYAFNTETRKIREVKKGKYIIDIDYPYITDKTPAAKAINDAIHKEIASRQSEFASRAEEISFLDTVEPFSLKTAGEPVICLNNGSVFSCYMLFADYEGAAYPWHSYEAFNFIINKGKVRPIGIRDVFGDNLNLATEKFVPEFKGDGNMLEEYGKFAVSGFGMEFLFDDFVFDTGGNSFIKKSIERKDIEDLIQEPVLKEFYSDPKAHINIDSEVIFPGGETIPYDSYMEVSLRNSLRVLDSKRFSLPMGESSVKNRWTFDGRDMKDGKDYFIRYDVYFGGIYAYWAEEPVTVSGYEKGIQTSLSSRLNDTKDKFIRVRCGLEYDREAYLPSDVYFECRLCDNKGKPIVKMFLSCLSQDSLDFIAKGNSLEKVRWLKVLARRGDNIVYESRDSIPISLENQCLPEKIKLYMNTKYYDAKTGTFKK